MIDMPKWLMVGRILRHYNEIYEQYKYSGLEEITLPDGDVMNVHDMLEGIKSLPKRQREAVELMCIQGLKEVEASEIMLPGSKWSSPVGAYKRAGLKKLAMLHFGVEE